MDEVNRRTANGKSARTGKEIDPPGISRSRVLSGQLTSERLISLDSSSSGRLPMAG
jgi:hypothetical protein